jgi:hypothetical protein
MTLAVRNSTIYDKVRGRLKTALQFSRSLITTPVQALLQPFRRSSPYTGNRYTGLVGHGGTDLGFNSYIDQELGKFNPTYVNPILQGLMRRSPIPRISLTLMAAALSERQYVVTGSTPAIESFHQRWINRLLPQLTSRATNAVWFGWQPFVLDYGIDDRYIVPIRANDTSVHTTDAWVNQFNQFAGLRTNGASFSIHRSHKMTWQGDWGNHYGEGQHLACYPAWYAWSCLLVWAMRYYQRSIDPIRIAFCRSISIPLPKKQRQKLGKNTVDLATVVSHSLAKIKNGGSIAVPMGRDGTDAVRLEQLEFADRADTWLKMISQQEQTQSTSCLVLPSSGTVQTYGSVNSLDARIANMNQLRMFEFISNELVVRPINEQLLPTVHALGNFEGPCPQLEGQGFQRETIESFQKILGNILAQPTPEIGEDGRPTGRWLRPLDMIKIGGLFQAMRVPHHSMSEVARTLDELGGQAPGVGGRPVEPQSERADERARGLDR